MSLRGDRDASRTPSGRAREALSRSTSQRATGSSAGRLEMHGLVFGGSGTGVWLNTRTTPWAAADQKRKTMPADGCAICVQLSVFKPARLKSGALYASPRYQPGTGFF